jgi:galactose mutarotase-like enzyme
VCHSGPEGFHHRIFEGPVYHIVDNEPNKQIIMYDLKVQHLEDNFPGTIQVIVKYTIEEEDKLGGVVAGKIGIEYEVCLLEGARETAIAMTNHRYVTLNFPNAVTLTSQEARVSQEQQSNSILRQYRTSMPIKSQLEPQVSIPTFHSSQHLCPAQSPWEKTNLHSTIALSSLICLPR